MPKIIEAEALKQQVTEAFANQKEIPFREIEKLIFRQENTGHTQVVRCKHCMEYIVQTGRCRRWGIHVRDDNHFCGYGLHLPGYQDGRYSKK